MKNKLMAITPILFTMIFFYSCKDTSKKSSSNNPPLPNETESAVPSTGDVTKITVTATSHDGQNGPDFSFAPGTHIAITFEINNNGIPLNDLSIALVSAPAGSRLNDNKTLKPQFEWTVVSAYKSATLMLVIRQISKCKEAGGSMCEIDQVSGLATEQIPTFEKKYDAVFYYNIDISETGSTQGYTGSGTNQNIQPNYSDNGGFGDPGDPNSNGTYGGGTPNGTGYNPQDNGILGTIWQFFQNMGTNIKDVGGNLWQWIKNLFGIQ